MSSEMLFTISVKNVGTPVNPIYQAEVKYNQVTSAAVIAPVISDISPQDALLRLLTQVQSIAEKS